MVIDNFDLWEMQEIEADILIDELPLCEICGHPIMQDEAVYYNDQWFCESCENEAWEAIREDFLESTTE